MKLKIKIISLACEIERRNFMKNEMKMISFLDSEIIDAINGKNIIESKTQIPFISTLYYENKIKTYDSRLKLNGKGLTKGEIGCAWSHLNVYEMLLKDDDYDAYLVLEDDAKLLISTEELKIYLEELKELDFDVCHISMSDCYDFNRACKVSERFWIPEKRYFNRATGYIIKKSGLKNY